MVTKMKNLTWLGLRNTKITDNGVKALKALQFLRFLNLSGTQVTDSSIKELSQMKDLEEIYLWNTKVSESGVETLRKSLPEAKIIWFPEVVQTASVE
jgi:Leucine-rich repeat (LRR) protein